MFLYALLISLLFVFCNGNNPPNYKVDYFEQTVDHFNDMSYPGQTFKQKILYQDANWKEGSGPIFFYTGNEGAIESFWDNSGYVHLLAKEFNALVIFAEHRFYGTSLPFGQSSFKPPYLGLLTTEQAMADYAILLNHINKNRNATGCKVITFGGSYGGMLAAYMRFKYPNLVHGALAASAPIYMEDPSYPKDWFFSAVTKDFKDASLVCYTFIKRAFVVQESYAKKGAPGLKKLSDDYKLCEPMKTLEDFHYFQGWLRNAFVMLSMMDYPYATQFMGNLPANPVKTSCDLLLDERNPLIGVGIAAGVYYNQSATQECFDYKKEYIPCADPTGCGVGNDGIAWDYQACTEILLPGGTNGVTDMFPILPFTPEMKSNYCQKKYGVKAPIEWSSVQFWGQNIKSASNIIFSNGDLDPWRGGGVIKDISDSVMAIFIEGAAHHLDLRSPNKDDPPSVTAARKKERDIIAKWLA